MSKSCEMCLMPLGRDPGQSGSVRYCSFCFQDGRLVYEGDDLKAFQRQCYANMRTSGMNALKARFFAWSIRFAPHWKHKRSG
ncbi:MAG: hypothetical protein ISN29_11730 [Gammaproteobacteria bacterium AqS3]|nr:hypothetical protein [Gammaproteobacteria bacterium AqS3]